MPIGSHVANDQDGAIGKNRVGNTSKIHLAVNAYGQPIALEITVAQINNCTQAASLIARTEGVETIAANKGDDALT